MSSRVNSSFDFLSVLSLQYSLLTLTRRIRSNLKKRKRKKKRKKRTGVERTKKKRKRRRRIEKNGKKKKIENLVI